MPDTDVWATWLRTGRDGGSARMRAENLERLASVRDQILDRAEIQAGDTVLDVGAGQGLLGLGALERSGPGGTVIFSDISEPLLDDCRTAVAQASATDRSTFVRASATDLSAIASESVDVVVEPLPSITECSVREDASPWASRSTAGWAPTAQATCGATT